VVISSTRHDNLSKCQPVCLHRNPCDSHLTFDNLFRDMSIIWRELTYPAGHYKTAQRSLTTSPAMPVVVFWARQPKPNSTRCMWRIRWRNAHGRCCYYPEFLTQTVSLKRCSIQRCQPVWDRGPERAFEVRGGISCGSFGSPRSRRCSWGNRWRWAAIPPQTQSTLVRCCQTLLWGRTHGDWNEASIHCNC